MRAGPLDTSYRYCEAVARREARNFYYSFRLLPPARRRAMSALYGFMRHTDDLADEAGEPAAKRAALAAWRAELVAALAEPAATKAPSGWAGWPAFADTVRRHAIPVRHLHEVIDGVAMDVEPRRFATFDELYHYCYLVASAVGLCCIRIWGYESSDGRAERLAESCGIALQLTNIIRDVSDDARAGRVYLPREDLERFGVTPAELAATATSEPLRRLLAHEGQRAYHYYEQARPLVGLVAPVGRPVLRAIAGIYRALLDEIAGRGYDVAPRRIALPGWRKAAITVRSLVR